MQPIRQPKVYASNKRPVENKDNLYWDGSDDRTKFQGNLLLWVNQRANEGAFPLLTGRVEIPIEQIEFALEYARHKLILDPNTKEKLPALVFEVALWEVDPNHPSVSWYKDSPPFYKGKVTYRWQDMLNEHLREFLKVNTNRRLEHWKEIKAFRPL
jgi:hypothetical protein